MSPEETAARAVLTDWDNAHPEDRDFWIKTARTIIQAVAPQIQADAWSQGLRDTLLAQEAYTINRNPYRGERK